MTVPNSYHTRQEKKTAIGLPASLISKPIAHGPHVIPNGCPFGAADDANVFNR